MTQKKLSIVKKEKGGEALVAPSDIETGPGLRAPMAPKADEPKPGKKLQVKKESQAAPTVTLDRPKLEIGSTGVSDANLSAKSRRRDPRREALSVYEAVAKDPKGFAKHGIEVGNPIQAARSLATATANSTLEQMGLLVQEGGNQKTTPLAREQVIVQSQGEQLDKLRKATEVFNRNADWWQPERSDAGVYFGSTAPFKAALIKSMMDDASTYSGGKTALSFSRQVAGLAYSVQHNPLTIRGENSGSFMGGQLVYGLAWKDEDGKPRVAGFKVPAGSHDAAHASKSPELVLEGAVKRTRGQGMKAQEERVVVKSVDLKDWLSERVANPGSVSGGQISGLVLDQLKDQGIHPVMKQMTKNDLLPEGLREKGGERHLPGRLISAALGGAAPEIRASLRSIRTFVDRFVREEKERAKAQGVPAERLEAYGRSRNAYAEMNMGLGLGEALIETNNYLGVYGRHLDAVRDCPFLKGVRERLDEAFEGVGIKRGDMQRLTVDVDRCFTKALDPERGYTNVRVVLDDEGNAGKEVSISELDGFARYGYAMCEAMKEAREVLERNLPPEKKGAWIEEILGEDAQRSARYEFQDNVADLVVAGRSLKQRMDAAVADGFSMVLRAHVGPSYPGKEDPLINDVALRARMRLAFEAERCSFREEGRAITPEVARLDGIIADFIKTQEVPSQWGAQTVYVHPALAGVQDVKVLEEIQDPTMKSAVMGLRETMKVIGSISYMMSADHTHYDDAIRVTKDVVTSCRFEPTDPKYFNFPTKPDYTDLLVRLKGTESGVTWGHFRVQEDALGNSYLSPMREMSEAERRRAVSEWNKLDHRIIRARLAVEKDQAFTQGMSALNVAKLDDQRRLLSVVCNHAGPLAKLAKINLAGNFLADVRLSGEKVPISTIHGVTRKPLAEESVHLFTTGKGEQSILYIPVNPKKARPALDQYFDKAAEGLSGTDLGRFNAYRAEITDHVLSVCRSITQTRAEAAKAGRPAELQYVAFAKAGGGPDIKPDALSVVPIQVDPELAAEKAARAQVLPEITEGFQRALQLRARLGAPTEAKVVLEQPVMQ